MLTMGNLESAMLTMGNLESAMLTMGNLAQLCELIVGSREASHGRGSLDFSRFGMYDL